MNSTDIKLHVFYAVEINQFKFPHFTLSLFPKIRKIASQAQDCRGVKNLVNKTQQAMHFI